MSSMSALEICKLHLRLEHLLCSVSDDDQPAAHVKSFAADMSWLPPASCACSPYDTMEEVIGTRGTPGHGSLMEWGVTYRELELAPGGGIDWETLKTAIVPGERVAYRGAYSVAPFKTRQRALFRT